MGLGGRREEEGESLVGEEGAGGQSKFTKVGRVQPQLSGGDRGDLRDVDEIDLEQQWARSGESDDRDIGDQVTLDELDLKL